MKGGLKIAKWGSCDYQQLKRLRDKVEKFSKVDLDAFCIEISRELAYRLIAKTRRRTPTDTGALRRGWTNGQSTSPKAFASTIPVIKAGNEYRIDITNVVDYAASVEFGHRQTPGRFVPAIGKKLKKGWVKGRFMLTISENELRGEADKIIEQKLMQVLSEVFK